jgi:hypothetical protein
MERATMGEPAKKLSFDDISLDLDDVIDVESKEVKKKPPAGCATPLENKPEKVQCQICKRWFKSITGMHLNKIHHITMSDYIKQFPDAETNNAFTKKFQEKVREKKELFDKVNDPNSDIIVDTEALDIKDSKTNVRDNPITGNNYYIDAEGRRRFKDTKELVAGSNRRATSRVGRPKETDVERFLRQDLIGPNGEQVFYALKDILTYDQAKAKHKVPYYRAEHKLRAAQLLLEYGLGKPIQRSESNSTVKSLSVKVGVKMPEDLDIGDF